MKTLTLLRHAKSGWTDAVPRDLDRPLNAKGHRAAEAVGRHWRALGFRFDHVLASPAVRVAETIAAVEAGYGRPLAPEWDRRLYLAPAVDLLEIVRDLPDDADAALLVAHDPGLADLALDLTPNRAPDQEENGGDPLRAALAAKYPTASTAVLALDVARWADAVPAGGRLVRFIRPRDIDPAFGPDPD